jgi:GDP-L-fucose synthase
MKILITGSTGMVGHNLLENKDIAKHDLLTPDISLLDLLDYSAVKRYLSDSKPDMVIHCAGQVGGIQANMKDLYGFFTNNMKMGLNLVDSAKELKIPKFLNLSSSCAYPRNYQNPLKEEYILQGELEPTNEGYALAKLSVQRMCRYISKEYPDLQYKTLIPCNLYGRWDKFEDKHSHLVPSIIKKIHLAIKHNVPEIEIWGDGTVRREFMYAADLALAVAKAISHFDSSPAEMNIGLGYDYTIKEYYETAKKVMGYSGIFTHDLTKPVGMTQKLLDISRATEWGWKAETSLEEGIKQTYQYFLEYYEKI